MRAAGKDTRGGGIVSRSTPGADGLSVELDREVGFPVAATAASPRDDGGWEAGGMDGVGLDIGAPSAIFSAGRALLPASSGRPSGTAVDSALSAGSGMKSTV
jgi:hypothetical protein